MPARNARAAGPRPAPKPSRPVLTPRANHADPVGALEIAERLGLRRQTVAVWRQRHEDFPPPRWTVSGYPAWDWHLDILPWLAATGRDVA